MSEIYLDNAASTPIDPRVLDVFISVSKNVFGNPSNIKHSYGRLAKQVLESSRAAIGNQLGLSPNGIIFTSGATEANNLFLRGLTCLQEKGCAIAVSQIEHSCIDESLKFLHNRGVTIKVILTQPNGQIDLVSLENIVNTTPNLRVISVMLVNNETGVIQPLLEILRIAKKKNILVHTDAVQAIGKIALPAGLDMISISAHKLNGPKGVGCLWIRPDLKISPLLVGGKQEFGIRSGTTPVPLVAAFAKAVEIAVTDNNWINNVNSSMRLLEATIKQAIPEAIINGASVPRIPTISNISFPYKTLIIDQLQNVAASSGAACNCSKPQPSKVLLAMKLPETYAKNNLRLSAGRFNTPEEILIAKEQIIIAAKKSQSFG